MDEEKRKRIRKIILYLTLKNNGIQELIVNDLKAGKKPESEKDLETAIAQQRYDYLTVADSDYPEKLKHGYSPVMLFYEGNKEVIDDPETSAELRIHDGQVCLIALLPVTDEKYEKLKGFHYFIGCSNQEYLSELLENFHEKMHLLNFHQEDYSEKDISDEELSM